MQSPYCQQLTSVRSGDPSRLQKLRPRDGGGRLRPLVQRQRRLPRAVRAKWLRETQALLAEGAFRNTLEEATAEHNVNLRASIEELIERPVVALRAENEQDSLENCCSNTKGSASLPKLSVVVTGNALAHPKLQRHEKAFAAIRKRARYPVGLRRLNPARPPAIEPLMSAEVIVSRLSWQRNYSNSDVVTDAAKIANTSRNED